MKSTMAVQLEGIAKFRSALFLSVSKKWASIFSWISVVLCGLLTALVVNDFVHYEITEMTELTTAMFSVIIYFFHLLGFWLALVALVWTNETTHRRQFLPQLTGLVMSHVLLFLVRVVCEIYYVEYRPEFYRDIDEGDDFFSPYCAATISS